MNLSKSLSEFLGTYIAFMIIYYIATKHKNYLAIGVGFTFFMCVLLFSRISSNFNPVATLIFVLSKKQPPSDLVTLVIPQLLAGYAVFLTYKFII